MPERNTSILHIITKMAVGGAQMNTLISCREITRMGYPSAVLTGPEISPEGTFDDLSEKYGIPVFRRRTLFASSLPITISGPSSKFAR